MQAPLPPPPPPPKASTGVKPPPATRPSAAYLVREELLNHMPTPKNGAGQRPGEKSHVRIRAAWLDEEGEAVVQQCALLLNAMWPKSLEWRLNTLRKQPLPCSNHETHPPPRAMHASPPSGDRTDSSTQPTQTLGGLNHRSGAFTDEQSEHQRNGDTPALTRIPCLLPRSMVFLLENDASIAGSMPSAVVAHGKLKEGEGGGTLIESVVVADQLRGKGFGRTLMEELERRASSMGLREAWLTTDNQEGFYSALGYAKQEQDVPGWAVKGGGRGPAPPAALIKAKMSAGVWMRKDLANKA